ncbi:MAG TPA: trypsin-like peptidase domain-containing protein [Acidimicrobiia bacterium]|nr:trypsin-like peptidase domain-containing protein [Acidimicrobiia bacterium]
MIRRLLPFLLAVAACAGDTVPASTTTTTPSTTTTTLGAAGVYALVSQSLAFVTTPVGSGSGMLIDATTLVTNAHVVWPATTVTVSFPSGLGGDAPVVGYDWMADLALIDVSSMTGLPPPVDTDTTPLGPGTDVYLVGYPADDASTAEPAITSGIVSRSRTWPDGELTFIQSDALISGGQSGGALVNREGRVVGISGLSVGDGFALALTASDLLERIGEIRNGVDRHLLGARSVADLTGAVTIAGSVPHVLDEVVFVFDGKAGDVVALEIDATSVFNADLVGPDGFIEATTGEPGLNSVLSADLVLDGPYFVVVYPDHEPIASVTVAGVEVREWIDPDHGVELRVGDLYAGSGDYPGDLDWFRLDLRAGQSVTITATSINIDASLMVDFLDPTAGSAFAGDSDSGGGVIGFDARLEFTAPETASYAVVVFDETGFGPGGYVIRVEGTS